MAQDTRIMNELVDSAKAPRDLWRWMVVEFRWIIRAIVSACERFYWDNGFSRAAALAYTTLLSLVPVTVVGFGIIASFAASNQYVPAVREFIFHHFAPNIHTVDTVLEHLTAFGTIASSQNLSVVACLIFVVTALLLINSIEYALNEIWQVFEPRTIAQRIQIFCAILVVGPILALSVYYYTTVFRLEVFTEGTWAYSTVNFVYQYVVPFLIDFLAFFFLYFMVPKAPVKLSAAIFGAALVAILFDFAKYYFAIYIVRFASYEFIYGNLAAIPIFLFWLYVSWSIVLFGAELCYQAQYLPREGKIWKRTVGSVGDGRLILAVQGLVMISHSFFRGERLPSELELAERLGCSTVVLRPIIDSLKRAGILVQSDSRDMSLSLQRSPESILLSHLREALYQGRNAVHYPREMGRLFEKFSSGKADDTTLADLLKE